MACYTGVLYPRPAFAIVPRKRLLELLQLFRRYTRPVSGAALTGRNGLMKEWQDRQEFKLRWRLDN
jgi:hypothetical protein